MKRLLEAMDWVKYGRVNTQEIVVDITALVVISAIIIALYLVIQH